MEVKLMFENNKINAILGNKKTEVVDVNYTRFIASWFNACKNVGKNVYYDDEFVAWLTSMVIDKDTANDIRNIANCGKMELEDNARRFIMKK